METLSLRVSSNLLTTFLSSKRIRTIVRNFASIRSCSSSLMSKLDLRKASTTNSSLDTEALSNATSKMRV